ncbi:aminoglycoside 6-adenylyltransferase [Sporolactobacillus laevolacticus]|uniref:aminoglycoside 6-adenylyltransferase n=1 Tax=Sporolactobacillus laevolacticus TaxID=33018 RepID=UPI0025B44760|nr:aminoglycoside 6-adenylyltransferase [Sporolactobacillus laevolacticus]MDN3955203.1 aminoglycoside 6-adenylyltransferase [Sporolactobacillus laevolacticus]
MRNEQEMMNLILNTAKEDGRIRAVIMNGSRTNPNAPRDCFQDYDIVYVVGDIQSFTSDHRWVDRFGKQIIMQMPDDSSLFPTSDEDSFAYLMLFEDGNRIDLTLMTADKANEWVSGDSLSILLLDKDGIITPIPSSSDRDYQVQPPTAAQFASCCNEFWWVSPYVAKGLWRDEIPYAKAMLEEPVRDMLLKMLGWYAGVRTDFTVSAGKCGKYLNRYVEAPVWNDYLLTYPDANSTHIWQSLFKMGELFRTIAKQVADHFGYTYPEDDDRRVFAYLKHVHQLPAGATEVY